MEHNYYLAHHGVKGQKWGIRKKRELSGTRPVKSKKSKSGDRTFDVKIDIVPDPKTLKKNVRKSIAVAIGFGAAATVARVGARKMMSQGDALRARRLTALALAATGGAVGSAASAIGNARTLRKLIKFLMNLKGK